MARKLYLLLISFLFSAIIAQASKQLELRSLQATYSELDEQLEQIFVQGAIRDDDLAFRYRLKFNGEMITLTDMVCLIICYNINKRRPSCFCYDQLL